MPTAAKDVVSIQQRSDDTLHVADVSKLVTATVLWLDQRQTELYWISKCCFASSKHTQLKTARSSATHAAQSYHFSRKKFFLVSRSVARGDSDSDVIGTDV